MGEFFRKFARKSSDLLGRAEVFLLALVMIVIWAALGPLYHYSDTWQLVINTATTIVTFLMVFLIQNTQNRDAKAIQLKLDELIRAVQGAVEGAGGQLRGASLTRGAQERGDGLHGPLTLQ